MWAKALELLRLESFEGGTNILLEDNVLRCGVKAGLEPIIIIIHQQKFTKTANAWGVTNTKKGTNTHRIVLFKNDPVLS